MSKESEDKKKFEKWQRMFYASSNKELNHLSKGFDGKDASMFEEFAFLAGLKAGREEWEKKVGGLLKEFPDGLEWLSVWDIRKIIINFFKAPVHSVEPGKKKGRGKNV